MRPVPAEKNPPTVPLARGSAIHIGMEAVYAGATTAEALEAYARSLRGAWPKIPDPRIKVNLDDPSQPAGKVAVKATLAQAGRADCEQLKWIFDMLRNGWDAYSPTRALRAALDGAAAMPRIERELGEVARQEGMPYAMATAWDYEVNDGAGGWVDKPVGLVAGVMLQGRVDLEVDWVGLAERPYDGIHPTAIIDHKGVSNVVPFWGWRRTPFECSYDPVDSLQLDAYAAASGILRCGFQYVLKNPQFVPKSGRLQPHWLPEDEWRAVGDVTAAANGGTPLIPIAWASDAAGDLRYVCAWRPVQGDHGSIGADCPDFSHATVYERAGRKLRRAAEALTEGVLLVQAGVAPEVAFPPGSPADIGRKACPSCHFRSVDTGGTGACRAPMELPKKNRDALAAIHNKRRALLAADREAACLRTPAVLERRQEWALNPLSDHHARTN